MFLGRKPSYWFRENIGQNLAPERAARAASGSANDRDVDAQLFDDFEAILLAVRDPFDNSSNEIGSRMFAVNPIQPPRARASRCGVRSPIR